MHFSFIPYGKRSEVELLLRDMEAQKHLLKMTKDQEERSIYVQGQVRLLPLGVYEYVFPKEDLDTVLYTMIRNDDVNRYGLPKVILSFLRKFYKLKAIPTYKKEKNYLWIRDHVEIIPLGIREDGSITEDTGSLKGFQHESL